MLVGSSRSVCILTTVTLPANPVRYNMGSPGPSYGGALLHIREFITRDLVKNVVGVGGEYVGCTSTS